MSIFSFKDEDALGRVIAVDTASVMIKIDDIERLRRLQVNRLAVLQSSRAGQHLIGIVVKITRKTEIDLDSDTALVVERDNISENNIVRITLIGTLIDKVGSQSNLFRRTLETVPEIDANCFALEGYDLTQFMQIISEVDEDGPKLALGKFTLDDNAIAYLNGNRLFQRHALVVGSTGSGKSFTVARLLDQISALQQANAVLFDIHGEYKPLNGQSYRHLRIAGPSDMEAGRTLSDGVLHLPYWLLGHEALEAIFVDRSEQNAPNQVMLLTKSIIEEKKKFLEANGNSEIIANFTIDSPIPFDLQSVIDHLDEVNVEMVTGSSGRSKQGDFHGKLSRFIARLEAKRTDRRLAFLFQPPAPCMQMAWLTQMAHLLIAGTGSQNDSEGGIKIIDFSEVPSDVLPLMVSLLARILFTTQVWSEPQRRHPIAIFCDEAHLYIPDRTISDSSGAVSVEIFERIAKEGRKYGVGLVVVTQRPSEVNKTVLSQCNNVIAMRLTNGDDQNVIRRLLPDNLGGFGDLLPLLDTGETLVVGDASLLPSRLRVDPPSQKPNSGTVPFWERWNGPKPETDTAKAVNAWRRQSSY